MRNHTLTLQERSEARNVAQWAWLYVKDEPLAGNSSVVKVIGAPPRRVPRTAFVKRMRHMRIRARLRLKHKALLASRGF